MIDFIKSFFNRDPATKIRKAIKKKYKSAMLMQRNGKLREFAEIMKEIETLEKQYDEVFDENRR